VGGDITPRLYHSIEFSPGVFDTPCIYPHQAGASTAFAYLAQLSADVLNILLGQSLCNIRAMQKSTCGSRHLARATANDSSCTVEWYPKLRRQLLE
jgi:hypothetical protein